MGPRLRPWSIISNPCMSTLNGVSIHERQTVSYFVYPANLEHRSDASRILGRVWTFVL